MCCRYYYSDLTEEDVKRIAKPYSDAFVFGVGEPVDICPSMSAVVICGQNNSLVAGKMKWGFEGVEAGKLLINARAETALNKRTFRDHVLKHRCVVPAGHFYEWDRQKNKAEFYNKGEKTLYMAGCFNEAGRFVILTTAANDSMIETHDRMPLIFSEALVYNWIFAGDSVETFLNSPSPQLVKKQDYKQISFDSLLKG